MGSAEYMKQQIEDKIKQGFSCIKLKIGALDFDLELSLIAYIRQFFDEHQMMIRVDANGAFNYIEALDKITQLSEYKLHSIEQPIAKGYPDKMAILCKNTPLPIALDEELIGVYDLKQKQDLLDEIKPQFIILKPSLVGGFKGSQEWIQLAEARNIGWWVTSALESNIGLNAIAQWTYTLNSSMYQGLGTGGLYTNNFDSPLTISEGKIYYDENKPWSLPDFIK
jgi:L-alanine-DL-glutamate epimerase-like enolase superfamily enzyme